MLEEYFKLIYTKTNFSFTDTPTAVPDYATSTHPDLTMEVLQPFTRIEVQQRLQKASNTAPGADSITYSDLWHEDPGCHVLTEIFLRCWEGKMPVQWKSSTTVLIHKQNDVSEVTNWRPLALSTTISKLFAAFVTDHTTLWVERLSLLSPDGGVSAPLKAALSTTSLYRLQLTMQGVRVVRHALPG